jgi:hypothetical protein
MTVLLVASLLTHLYEAGPSHYSGTRVDVSRNRGIQVDATGRERRPSMKFVRTQLLWFRSRSLSSGDTFLVGPEFLCDYILAFNFGEHRKGQLKNKILLQQVDEPHILECD